MNQQATLSAAQLGEIQEDLLRQLSRLERSAPGTRKAVELDQSCIGRLSRIEALQNQSMMQSLQERERVRLASVLDALERIETGSYGTCHTCGDSIEPERLLIFPETRHCSACSIG